MRGMENLELWENQRHGNTQNYRRTRKLREVGTVGKPEKYEHPGI
jgi:hypothetical protein